MGILKWLLIFQKLYGNHKAPTIALHRVKNKPMETSGDTWRGQGK